MNIFKDNVEKILSELRDVRQDLALLQGERDATKKSRDLDKEIAELRRTLTDLEIQHDREQEKWDREKREVEHMVGLHKQKAEFENESATREAKISVREENLEADKTRFEEHVSFMEGRFQEELTSLRGLMEKFLDRMPTTQQLITVGGKEEENGK